MTNPRVKRAYELSSRIDAIMFDSPYQEGESRLQRMRRRAVETAQKHPLLTGAGVSIAGIAAFKNRKAIADWGRRTGRSIKKYVSSTPVSQQAPAPTTPALPAATATQVPIPPPAYTTAPKPAPSPPATYSAPPTTAGRRRTAAKKSTKRRRGPDLQ